MPKKQHHGDRYMIFIYIIKDLILSLVKGVRLHPRLGGGCDLGQRNYTLIVPKGAHQTYLGRLAIAL